VDISHAVAEAILSMSSDAIIAADREGIIHFWNSGAGRLFGYSPDEAISRSLDFIIPERLRQRHWDGYRRVMETGKAATARATCSRFRLSARMAPSYR
jgi:PAS domain S-box-containing protein